jgi:hypothetical protein
VTEEKSFASLSEVKLIAAFLTQNEMLNRPCRLISAQGGKKITKTFFLPKLEAHASTASTL